MDYKQIAQDIKDANESIFLIYAFNGTGKTQLSVSYKDITKSIDNIEYIQPSIGYTGIKAEVVINYKDAIEKLTRLVTYKKDCF